MNITEMTKDSLIEMGLTEELAAKVMTALSGNYIPRNRYNEISEDNKTLKADKKELLKQIADRDGQLDTLKSSAGDNEELTKQIAALQTANQTAKDDYEKQMNQMKVDFAVEKALAGAKAKNVKAVMALLDLKDAKLQEDGTVKGLSEQIEKLSKAEDSKFLFEETQAKPKLKGFQPGASSEKITESTENMTYSQMVAYLAENPGAKID